MSDLVARRAERTKLARLLRTDPDALDYLETLSVAEMRDLREASTGFLFDADQSMLSRLAAGSGLLPTAVVATIGERVFGALLCARVAGRLPPDRAREVARKLDTEFLADVAIELDPRRAEAVISGMPAEIAGAVAAELSRRGEDITMGRFVGVISEEAIDASLEVIPDERLLPIAFVMEDTDRLAPIVARLDDRRLLAVLTATVAEYGWADVLELLDYVDSATAGRVGDLVAGDGSRKLLGELIITAHERGQWPRLLPINAAMEPDSRRAFATHEALQEPQRLRTIVEVASREPQLWGTLLPLVELLPADSQATVAEAVAALDPAHQRELVDQVVEVGLVPELLRLARTVDPATREVVANLVADAEPAVLDAALEAADGADLWDDLGELFATLPGSERTRIAERAETAGYGDQLSSRLG